MSRLYAAVGLVVLAGIVSAPLVYKHFVASGPDAFAACRGAAVAGGQIGGAFNLTDTKGNPVTEATVLAKPALVYFGYASCPDVCPLDNARNDEAADLLAKQGLEVVPVFISVDPDRDTPAVLADYVSNFSHLTGLTGTAEQVAAAAKAYKVFYQLPAQRSEGYTVDHTTMTYLMLPKTGFADFFQRDATAQQIADRTACFLKAS